jgi:hypothetical protein
MVTYVVDISNWQGDVDMSSWLGIGIQGCLAKALEGMTGVDAKWYQNKAKLLKWGGVPGAYHYINNIHTGADQCNAFLDLVPANFIHALDAEGPNIGLQRVDDWFAAYRKRYPHKVVWLYTNYGMWTQVSKIPGNIDAPNRWGPVVIWVAGAYAGAYQSGTDDFRKIWSRVPAGADGGLPFLGFTEYVAMQYSGSADVPGVSGPCDMSVFGGAVTELRKYTQTSTTEEDMPLTNADADLIINRLLQHNVDATADGPQTVVAMLARAAHYSLEARNFGQQIAAATDTLEASETAQAKVLAAIQAAQADDVSVATLTQVLNDKLGTGPGGGLTKEDVAAALQQVISGTKFVPEGPA